MLAGELHAHPAPRLVQVAALHVRVGPGEVDELEHAQGGIGLRIPHGTGWYTRLQDHDLPGLDVTHEFGADDVEAGGLG